jgi:hypothetical protein
MGGCLLRLVCLWICWRRIGGSESKDHLDSSGNIVGGPYLLNASGAPLNPDSFGGFAFRPAAISNVPELPTWAMMLLGFAGLGVCVFCRSREPSTVSG